VRNVEFECCLCARFHDPSCKTDVARVAFARGQPFERNSSIFQPAVKIFEFVLALKHPAYGFKTPPSFLLRTTEWWSHRIGRGLLRPSFADILEADDVAIKLLRAI